MYAGIEISVSPEARDVLFFGWAWRISENFNGKGPCFKEMDVLAYLCLVVIPYTGYDFYQFSFGGMYNISYRNLYITY